MSFIRFLIKTLLTIKNRSKKSEMNPEMDLGSCFEMDSGKIPTFVQMLRVLDPRISQLDMAEASFFFDLCLARSLGVTGGVYTFNLPVTWNGEELIVTKRDLFYCAKAIAREEKSFCAEKDESSYIQ